MTNEERIPTEFKDIALSSPCYPDVARIEIKELIDKDIIIKEFEERPSTFGGTFIIALAEVDGEERTFPIGSKVVISQLQQVKELNKLPVKTKIIEQKSSDGRVYHTLS
jgi:hypothetical protein